jgi:hypothetical protein
MSNNNIAIFDESAMYERKAAIDDAYMFSQYIPDELRAQLEAGLSEEMRIAVLQLQILAIKFGRAVERQKRVPKLEMVDASPRASNLAMQLVDRAGREMAKSEPIHTVNENKKVDILVAPGFLDLTKKA